VVSDKDAKPCIRSRQTPRKREANLYQVRVNTNVISKPVNHVCQPPPALRTGDSDQLECGRYSLLRANVNTGSRYLRTCPESQKALPFKQTSMRRHYLSRPTWRPRCSDASFPPDAPSARFHSHSRRSRDADRVHDGVRPLGARRCYLGSGLSVVLGGQVRLRSHRPRGDRGPCGTLAP